jgi:hypothetical protein
MVGLALRLSFPGDLEFKADEAYMWAATQGLRQVEPFPALGMPSGAGGLRNPGLSIWAFSAPAQILKIQTPEGLALFVSLCFLAALLGAALWARIALAAKDRVLPYLALGLAAVNPYLVLYTRKPWAQSLLPVLLLPAWIGLSRRDRCWGAFLWSFAGTLMGQLHMSGFIWAAATGLGVLIDASKRRSTRWAWVVAGGVAASCFMLPWFSELGAHGAGAGGGWPSIESLVPRYWLYGLDTLLAFPFAHTLGGDVKKFYLSFAWGLPSLLAALQIALVVAALALGLRRRGEWPRWERWSLFVLLVLMALVFALSGLRVHRHYWIVAMPALWMLWVRCALWAWPRRAFLAACLFAIAQAGSTALLLAFIHRQGGAAGDFGTSLRLQSEETRGRIKIPDTGQSK